VIDITTQIEGAVAALGYGRVGLLATDTVMKTRIYGGLAKASTLIPPPDRITGVHRAYVDMAIAARVTDTQRALFFAEGRDLIAGGADAVLLGGTDFDLAFKGHDPGFPVVDCTDLHIACVMDWARKAAI